MDIFQLDEEIESDGPASAEIFEPHSYSTQTTKWVDDKSTTQCMVCSTDFTIMTRRHHCRICGCVICNGCSVYKKEPVFLTVSHHVAQHTEHVKHAPPPPPKQSFISMFSRAIGVSQKANAKACVQKRSVSLPEMHRMALEKTSVRTCTRCASQRVHYVADALLIAQLSLESLCTLRCVSRLFKKAVDIIMYQVRAMQFDHFSPWVNKTHPMRLFREMFFKRTLHVAHLQNPFMKRLCDTYRGSTSKNACMDSVLTALQRTCSGAHHDLLLYDIFVSNSRIEEGRLEQLSVVFFKLIIPSILTCAQPIPRSQILAYAMKTYVDISPQVYYWTRSYINDTTLKQACLQHCVELSKLERSHRWVSKMMKIVSNLDSSSKPFHNCRVNSSLLQPTNVVFPGTLHLVVKKLLVHESFWTQSEAHPLAVPVVMYDARAKSTIKRIMLFKTTQSVVADCISQYVVEYVTKTISYIDDRDPTELIHYYHVVPCSEKSGVLLFVPNSCTLTSLQTTLVNTISQLHNDQVPLGELRTPFSISVSLFTIIAIFLGWEDRTPSNIMLQMDTGTLFHIDFEYMFEQQPPVKGMLMWLLDGRSNRRISSTSSKSEPATHTPIHIASTSESVELNFAPELCPMVENMLGGVKSTFYNDVFVKKHCNHVFRFMYQMRPLLYYSTLVMSRVFSHITCTPKSHRLFFKNFASTAAGIKEGQDVGDFTLVSNDNKLNVHSMFDAVHLMYRAIQKKR